MLPFFIKLTDIQVLKKRMHEAIKLFLKLVKIAYSKVQYTIQCKYYKYVMFT